jgi:4-carboxymuconolactone decarboxylase
MAMNKALYDLGMNNRRAVLGDEHVDQSLAAADGFSMPIQEFVTQYCWGDIWSRPGLDRQTRSMLNLAMMTVMNRPHELRAHVKGAIRNGLTKEQIGEVLLHTAIYCGIPASLDAFRHAREVFRELGID